MFLLGWPHRGCGVVALKAGMLEFDGFRIDPTNAELLRGGEPVALPPKPFAVLCYLVERAGTLVTKDALLDEIWPNLHVSESSLTFAINAVRAALGDDARAPRYIQTVPRRGYRFVARVTALSGPEPRASRAQGDPVPPSATSATPRWWVGRAAPLDTLEALLRRAHEGERQTVFITGEGGIGKSTLIDMIVSGLAERQIGVMRGGCAERFGTDEAFLPLIEALQDRCAGADGPALLAALRDHAPTWLAQMPGVADASGDSGLQASVIGATRERMLREFCEFLEVISTDRTWVLVIEDLHWSDLATVDILSRFARRERRARVLVLATYRPVDVVVDSHPIRAVHQDLQIHRLCREVALDRLSRADVEAYVRMRFGDGPMCGVLAERVYRRTQGQPLFVVSLLDYFVAQNMVTPADGHWQVADEAAFTKAGLPQDLREMISRQIDRLTDEEQRVLEVASAAGPDFSAALVAGSMGKPVLQVENICETLARNGQILAPSGVAEWPDGTVSGRYVFQHDLYQEVLYRRLAPGQRLQTHRRLGEALEAGFEDATIEAASFLATHFEAGRAPDKAVRYLRQAAESSAKRSINLASLSMLTSGASVARVVALSLTSLMNKVGWP